MTEMDAMDSVFLITWVACRTIKFLCHRPCPLNFPLQLTAFEPSSLLDGGVHARSGIRGSIVSMYNVSPGGGAPGEMSVRR